MLNLAGWKGQARVNWQVHGPFSVQRLESRRPQGFSESEARRIGDSVFREHQSWTHASPVVGHRLGMRSGFTRGTYGSHGGSQE